MTMRKFTYFFILLLLVTGGCSPSSVDPEDLPAVCRIESLDQPAEEARVMTESGEVLSPDVQHYANDFGVDMEEAAYRLSLQEPIGRLNACLNSEEKDTFAGLWIEHEPSYQVFVAFTRDGEDTLAPYIAGSALEDIVKVRSAAVTYEELRAVQAETDRLLKPLNTPFSSGINIQENLVELYITDFDAFDAGIQDHDIELPKHLLILAHVSKLHNLRHG